MKEQNRQAYLGIYEIFMASLGIGLTTGRGPEIMQYVLNIKS